MEHRVAPQSEPQLSNTVIDDHHTRVEYIMETRQRLLRCACSGGGGFSMSQNWTHSFAFPALTWAAGSQFLSPTPADTLGPPIALI